MSGSNEIFTFRPVEEKDISLAINFRKVLFKEMGIPDESLVENAYDIILKLYTKELKEGRIRHFIAYNPKNEPVGIAGAILKNDFPYCLFRPGYYGWIIDVYTVPQYRGEKIATKLLELTNQWLNEKGIHESKLIAAGSNARILYERLGYKATWEMSLNLSNDKTYNELIDSKGEELCHLI